MGDEVFTSFLIFQLSKSCIAAVPAPSKDDKNCIPNWLGTWLHYAFFKHLDVLVLVFLVLHAGSRGGEGVTGDAGGGGGVGGGVD